MERNGYVEVDGDTGYNGKYRVRPNGNVFKLSQDIFDQAHLFDAAKSKKP